MFVLISVFKFKESLMLPEIVSFSMRLAPVFQTGELPTNTNALFGARDHCGLRLAGGKLFCAKFLQGMIAQTLFKQVTVEYDNGKPVREDAVETLAEAGHAG